MSNNEIRINKSHIAILKKNPKDLSIIIDYLKIDNPIEEETDSLLYLLSEENIPNDKLGSLLKKNLLQLKLPNQSNYCLDISDKYQAIFIRKDIIIKIENFIEKTSDSSLETISNFSKILIVKYVKEYLENKKAAKTYNKSLDKVKSNHDVLMYSHRFYGWHSEEYKIDSNFKAKIVSNFGYGYVSYFLTTLTYNEIDIIPYYRLIEYKNAKVFELLRCSKSHFLNDEEWFQSFNYIIEATSLYYKSPKLFIEKYIINECEKLVEGLDKIATKSRFSFKKDNIIQPSKKSPRYQFETILLPLEGIKGRMLKLFRAEKITAALSFINQINKCRELFDISSIVNRIENLNISIKPMMLMEKESISSELNEAVKKHVVLEKKIDNLILSMGNKLPEYNKIKNRIQINNDASEIIKFLDKYPDFGKLNIEYNNLKESLYASQTYIKQIEEQKRQMDEFILLQNTYFNKFC